MAGLIIVFVIVLSLLVNIGVYVVRKYRCDKCCKWWAVSYTTTGHQDPHTGDVDEETELRQCSACGVAHQRKRRTFSGLSFAEPSDWSKC